MVPERALPVVPVFTDGAALLALALLLPR